MKKTARELVQVQVVVDLKEGGVAGYIVLMHIQMSVIS